MSRVLIRVLQPTFKPVSAERQLTKNSMGKNVGNYAFSYASERLFHTPENEVTADKIGRWFKNPEAVNESFDHVVMPLANHFRATNLKALHNQAEAMEQLNVPVTILGVGGQADLSGTVTKQAEEVATATVRFVRAALRNSPSIGVRGEYTKEYLIDLGIEEDRIDVIGCPSMFLHGGELPLRIPETIDPEGPLAINLSHYLAPMGPILLENLRRYPQLTYFAQDIKSLALIANGETAPGAQANPDLPLRPDHPAMQPGRSVFPLNMPTWMSELSQRQMSFGSRIHGNIVALLAGTPAIVLAHDSRTLELANYHRIPHFLISDLSAEEATAEALFARADWTELIEGHRQRFDTYLEFLDKHELPNIYGPAGGGENFDEQIATLESAGKFDPVVVSTGRVAPAPAPVEDQKPIVARPDTLLRRLLRRLRNWFRRPSK